MSRANVYLVSKLCPRPFHRVCRSIAWLLATALLILTASSAAAEVLTVHGAGAAVGSSFSPLERAFDDQPTVDPPTGQTYTVSDGGDGVSLYSNRQCYVDFGPDYANVRITGTWTLWRQFGRTPQDPITYWWSNSRDNQFNSDDIAETTPGFGWITSIPPNNPTSDHVWRHDYDGPAITPPRRYLILSAGASNTNGVMEFALTGTVEEPPPPPLPTTQVITPLAAGAAAGSQWFPLEHAFDDQPAAYPPTDETYTSADGGAGVMLYNNRQAYIDFGPDYESIRITGTWTLWRQWGRTPQGPITYWWSPTNDNVFDGSDVYETATDFGWANFVPPANPTSDHVWHREYDGPPITPQHRYLIVSAPGYNSNGMMEFAISGTTQTTAEPPPALTNLVLLDTVDCGDPNDLHPFTESAAGVSQVETVLGRQVRTLQGAAEPGYFAYRVGQGVGLVPGRTYVLRVEYPDDVPRTWFVQNQGAETTRGFHTGHTVGDALHAPYVNPNAESLELPQSGDFRTWEMLFHLHDRFADIKMPRSGEHPRPLLPADGFWVVIAHPRQTDAPRSSGASVATIKLYEAPTPEATYADVNLPPAGLPQRHLFYREEMGDGVIMTDIPQRGVDDPVDWFEYKARLMRFLGMNTFAKDMLEFGANQGWDSSLHGGNQWVFQNKYPDLWDDITLMLGDYGLNALPYYEYSGSKGYQGLGNQKRAEPLSGPGNYTHITWAESARADLTDPDTLTDFKKMLDLTVLNFKDRTPFVGVWLRARVSQMPIGFADATRERFRVEANNGVPVSRADLQNDPVLLEAYYDWWLQRRRQFINDVTDYLRVEGVTDAVTLYTSDASESGRSHPRYGIEYVVADDPQPWVALGETAQWLGEAISGRRQFEALTLPKRTWGGYEWQHADVWNDPHHYAANEGGLLTYSFNKAYTVGDPTAMDAFRTPSGLAMIRHFCLNEDVMRDNSDEDILGYFVADVELAGPYSMLGEARAVAHGDPRYLGYLSAHTFNRGFPAYARAFNTAFLSLPALPSQVLAGAASHPDVVVRKIATPSNGTYLAVVNTSVNAVQVTVTLPASGAVTDAATGDPLQSSGGTLDLTMWPCQLRAIHIDGP